MVFVSLPILAVLAMLASFMPASAQMVIPEAETAPGRSVCLSQEERAVAIAEKRAIPLAQAIHDVVRRPGELLSAHLCRGSNGLVYVLTLLPRDGKVTRAIVDAANGRILKGR